MEFSEHTGCVPAMQPHCGTVGLWVGVEETAFVPFKHSSISKVVCEFYRRSGTLK